MTEPISATTATVSASMGLMALLIGWVGPLAADVMMVVISAISGCFIALSSIKGYSTLQSISFILIGVTVSLVLSWALTGMLSTLAPSLSGPYAPSVIAMFLGFSSDRLGVIFRGLVNKVEHKIEDTYK